MQGKIVIDLEPDNKANHSVINFGKGWGIIFYCMAMFWFYVGFVNDGSNITAPAVAANLGVQSGTVLTCNSVAGVVGVLLQGLRCAPLPAPSPVGVLFLWMFALGAWTLGASFAQLGRGSEQGFARPLRLGLWLLLVTLVLVPCLGGTFVDTLMRLLSVAWMEFLPYWAAVMATGVAIGLSYMGRATAPVQAALVLVAAFCVRATMFVGGADLFL